MVDDLREDMKKKRVWKVEMWYEAGSECEAECEFILEMILFR